MNVSRKRDMAAEAYSLGQTMAHIARRLGVTEARVWQYINEHEERARIIRDHKDSLAEARRMKAYRKCRTCGKGFYDWSTGKVYCSRKCFARRPPVPIKDGDRRLKGNRK